MFIPSNNPGNMKKNNKIIPKPKNFPRSDLIFFSRQFEGEKTTQWNFTYQMKYKEFKINYFDGQNHC